MDTSNNYDIRIIIRIITTNKKRDESAKLIRITENMEYSTDDKIYVDHTFCSK